MHTRFLFYFKKRGNEYFLYVFLVLLYLSFRIPGTEENFKITSFGFENIPFFVIFVLPSARYVLHELALGKMPRAV